jgi:hypothetical protein
MVERVSEEAFGAMKMIAGSVFMLRADIIKRLGWTTSITEDWDLTLRLYLPGSIEESPVSGMSDL